MRKETTRGAAILLTMGVLGFSGTSVIAAPAATPQQRADAAYTAMGMSDIYRGEGTQNRETVITLKTTGTIQQWDPGESYSVADLLTPGVGMSTFVQSFDRGRGGARTEWVRPRAGGGTRTYTEILVPEGGYVIGNDANGAMTRRATMDNPPLHTMSGIRLTALMREQQRLTIALEMHDNPERLSAYTDQTIGGTTYPAVQYASDFGTFIALFDPVTSLPAVVRTRDFDYLMGDADFDATFSDWRDINGAIKLPYRITYTLNGVKVFDTTVQSYDLNTPLPSDVLRVPPALRGKEIKPAPANKVPYQWVLRRLASGFWLDSDALYTDDGGSLQLRDVAPNISLATGGSHNTLIVATGNSLVAFDAPGDDGQSQQVMALAAEKYPGKPFKYVVLTHHHIDHTGGIRAYAAAGATLVVGKGAGDFFRKALAAPQNTNVQRPSRPITPNVIEVDGKWSVTEGGRQIEAYSIDNPHAAGYLIPYVPDAKVGFVTDLLNPGGPAPAMATPNMTAVVRGLRSAGVTPDTLAGGHGSFGPYADFARVVQ